MTTGERSRGAGSRWSDEQVDQFLGTLLRAGVLVAAAVASVGGALYLVQYGLRPVDYGQFHGEPPDLRTVHGIVGGAFALRSASIVQLGMLVLIATPVARVASSLVAFVLQRDRMYVMITTVVLALLIFSLAGGPG